MSTATAVISEAKVRLKDFGIPKEIIRRLREEQAEQLSRVIEKYLLDGSTAILEVIEILADLMVRLNNLER